ncbi:MAG: RNA polymerase sigma-70 factor [Bacteroidetes bacterium MED-G17]|nr:MAG: hypothetical protein CBB99_02375 [Bacteroidetes bacterium TMED39]PDH51997.1 MAG: RNA polymerase sigma-70 factor [Bacteroidetes bacterium MED-G17]
MITKKEYQILFNKYYSQMVYLANTYLFNKEDAEEIVQDVFIKIWNKRNEIQDFAIKTYLFTSTKNASINFLRRKKIDSQSLESLSKFKSQNAKPLESLEFAQKIKKAIDQLPPKTKRVFLMSRYFEFTYKEIAQILSLSPKTIENQMGTALRLLKKKIFNEN